MFLAYIVPQVFPLSRLRRRGRRGGCHVQGLCAIECCNYNHWAEAIRYIRQMTFHFPSFAVDIQLRRANPRDRFLQGESTTALNAIVWFYMGL
jgi:hypothetical protein